MTFSLVENNKLVEDFVCVCVWGGGGGQRGEQGH